MQTPTVHDLMPTHASHGIRRTIRALGLIMMFCLWAWSPLLAQEGIISSVYIAERTALQKMHAARKAGNEAEVQRISSETAGLVEQKKAWARDLLTLTENELARQQASNTPALTPTQREELAGRIALVEADIRLLDLELEENTWAFQAAMMKRREYIKTFEKSIESILQYARETMEAAEKRAREAVDQAASLEAEHEKEYQVLLENIVQQEKAHQETIRQVNDGRQPRENIERSAAGVTYAREYAAKVRKAIDEGSHTSRAHNGTSKNMYRDLATVAREEIALIQKALADESFQHRYSGQYGRPTIRECRQCIATATLEMQKQRDSYAAEEWENRKDLRKRRQELHVELLRLQAEAGLKDEKIAALIERRNELERFLCHDFVTELPKEESGFLKAIRWIDETIDKVSKVAEKFERLKKVVTLVQSSNPAKALDLFLEDVTGKGLSERLAEKLLPKKVLENPLVQRLIRGERLSRDELVKEAVIESLPPDARRRVEEAIDVLNTVRSDNIRELVRQKGYEHAMRIIDAQPELRKAWETFDQAQKIVQNPALIEKRLEQAVTERVRHELTKAGRELTDAVVGEEVCKRLAQYQSRLEAFKTDIADKAGQVPEAVANGVLRSVKENFESRIQGTAGDQSSMESLILHTTAQ